MKNWVPFLVAFLAVAHSSFARDTTTWQWLHSWDHENNRRVTNERMKSRTVEMKGESKGVELIAGSRLPDCSHACHSCSPCKLVIVSSFCSSFPQASETCPLSYKCMCNNKSYPVP